jgi:hypothetical protein
MGLAFKKAVKEGIRLRFALSGPSGSGKTFTLLSVATALGGKIAAIDTERGSMKRYADRFDFDCVELESFDPQSLIDLIHAAESAGYASLLCDSLSHFWSGKDGELDKVDQAAARTKGNSFAAWKTVTPLHNKLIDTMLGAKINVLVSMRTKTEWVLEKDERTGKTQPRKIGLAPIMRDGIEYEFDVCGEMDSDNTLIVTKTRCPELAGKVFAKPGKELALILSRWMNSGAPQGNARQEIPVGGSKTAAMVLGEQIVAKMHEGKPHREASAEAVAFVDGLDPVDLVDEPLEAAAQAEKQWHQDEPKKHSAPPQTALTEEAMKILSHALASMTGFEPIIQSFKDVKFQYGELLQEQEYYRILGEHKMKHANEFGTKKNAQKCYEALFLRLYAIQSDARVAR